MALVVEDGTGKADAEAYLSEAGADAYWSAHGDPAVWTGATSAEKEVALREATEFVDEKWGRRFKGSPTSGTQRLRWPRYGVEVDDYALSSSEIPRRLTDAVAELAKDYLADGALFLNVDTQGLKKLDRTKVGSIEIEEAWASGGPGSSTSKVYSKPAALLRSFIDTTVGRG